MRIKRFLALVLACALTAGLLILPSSAARQPSAFPDITDEATAEAAEILRLLGIVSGTGSGNFEPGRTLTRAEFCKMAVEIMGNGDKVAAQMNRTVFADVPSTHWARGYVAVATQGSSSGSGESAVSTPGIIRGDATGRFHPDRAITGAEAVTILMRILGYHDANVGVGAVWYDGYFSTARSIGLTDGLTLNPTGSITRGQAAILFENLLFTKSKGSDDVYLTTLKGSITDEVLILDVNATAPDGSTGAVETGDGKVYQTDRVPFSDDMEGRQAKLVLDQDGHLLALQVSDKGTQRVVGILSAKYDSFTIPGGETVKVKPATTVWQDGEQKSYKDVYLNLKAGTQALLQYSAAGELEYVFLRDAAASEDATQVLKTKPSGTGTPSYQIYKNGVPATAADLRQYDVTTFDKNTNILYVSDLRLTGVYENASPSPDTPASITLLGQEFPVLSMAYEDLRAFDIGDQMTILLSYDGQVAGAVTASAASSTTVGVVQKVEGGKAYVKPLADIRNAAGEKVVLSGQVSYSDSRAKEMVGQVVTVSAGAKGRISLSKVSGSDAAGVFDVAAKKIGSVPLAENVALYERVGNGTPGEIDLEQLTVNKVAASKIVYVHKDYAGKADIVLLDDVTGDQYEYGFLKFTAGAESGDPGDWSYSKQPDTVCVKNSAHPNGSTALVTTEKLKNNAAIGIAASLDTATDGATPKLGAYVLLHSAEVKSSAFDMDSETLTTTDAVFPISRDVQCYNDATDSWFTSANEDDNFDALNAARAFSSTLTVYYDKSPDEGGKIRLVVAG